MLFLAVIVGILPGFAWLVFYLSEDPHPEPKRLIMLTFFSGISFGFFTIILEQFFNIFTAHIGIPGIGIVPISVASFAGIAFTLLGLAFIEEFTKFCAAYFAAAKSGEIDEPVDAMIYMVVAALGFATLENVGAITNVAAAASHGALIATVFETVSLRFVGATLLHSLTSAIVGYHWALGIAKKRVPEYLISGFIFATILHATFNYLILYFESIGLSILFLLLVGFFVLNDFEILKKTA